MSDTPESEDESGEGDAAFRNSMRESGFKPDADGILWGAARPKVLVAGAYKIIRTAAEKARQLTGKGR